MKKLLFIVLVLFVSCSTTYTESEVENQVKSTTVEIQHSIVDSCAIISVVGSKVYIIEDGLVTHRLSGFDADHVPVHIIWLMISIICPIIIMILLAKIAQD